MAERDLKADLDAIFDRHDEAKREAEAKVVAQQSAEDRFLAEFERLRLAVIVPALEKVAKLVIQRGHACKVTPLANSIGGAPPKVIFHLPFDEPRPHDPVGRQPHLTITADARQQHVVFSVSTMTPNRGGHAGPVGHAKLEAVTEELITAKAVDLVKEVYAR